MDKLPAKKWDQLIINANLATMADDGYGAIESGALAIANRRIAWLGSMKDLPGAPDDCARDVHSASGQWLTPGLIDCHTHLIFAGDRSTEFEQRMSGATYEEIAAAGGGILSTVRATREASESDLIEGAAWRLRHLISEGVTTIEIKSGYGLETESELRMLRAARRLDDRSPVRIVTTFLGAHAIPPEFKGDADGYIKLVCREMLPAAVDEGLVDMVDAYCEPIAFNRAQVAEVFEAAGEHDLSIKLHADQLSDGGGAELAAEWAARSAEHLEYTTEDGVSAMAEAGTVAVLLPGAFYSLRETRRPPVDLFRDYGVPMAVATDCNPGTSPLSSIITAMNMACTLFGMNPAEALRGVTVNAARALGLDDEVGSLEVGKLADLALWEIQHPAALAYWVGGRRCRRLYRAGEIVY
ncbi:MAG: imidazolonepropionase [Xanthomonadales bacterium]|nr:imidazolonepropionase [Xanthomonadales bacterium]